VKYVYDCEPTDQYSYKIGQGARNGPMLFHNRDTYLDASIRYTTPRCPDACTKALLTLPTFTNERCSTPDLYFVPEYHASVFHCDFHVLLWRWDRIVFHIFQHRQLCARLPDDTESLLNLLFSDDQRGCKPNDVLVGGFRLCSRQHSSLSSYEQSSGRDQPVILLSSSAYRDPMHCGRSS
jgi:hypothetical protein